MIKCHICGKELKHKGALNGHLAFVHGVITPNQLTLDKLRSEVSELRSEMDCFRRFFKLAPKEKNSEGQPEYLTAYDALNDRGIRLQEMLEKSWVEGNGDLTVIAELIED